MEILRVTQDIFPDSTGGGTYHVHALSRDQAEQGHEITVLSAPGTEGEEKVTREYGYTHVRCPVTFEVLGNRMSYCQLERIVNGNWDIIHAHSHLYFATNLASAIGRISSTPLAITNHGLYSQTLPQWISKIHLLSMGRFSFNSAEKVFTYTDLGKTNLRKIGVSTPIEVIPNGIDQDRFTTNGPHHDTIDSDDLNLLFVGRLVDGKRPQDAVDAFNKVIETHDNPNDIILYICGSGRLKSSLEQYVDNLDLIDNIVFLGERPYEEMPKIYRSSDILILPSQDEGLPRVVLESLACETPVITSNLPQLQPFTDIAGRSVEIGNVEGLADAIFELSENPSLRSQLGRRGRKLIEQKYTWESTVTNTTKQLQSLLADS